ncbi:MAG: hypothetical protein INR69_17760 [Mucilaginibacter polytrichastri]|nr:hypothetical protein [Mucilaginibacter polytrichastri]
MRHVLERIDLSRDLHFYTRTTIDTLDYSGNDLNAGSKVAVAVAGPKKRELATEVPAGLQLPDLFQNVKLILPGILAVEAPKYVRDEKAMGEIALLNDWYRQNPAQQQSLQQMPLLILCDDASFTAQNVNNFVWVTFTRSNPSHDLHGFDSFTEHKHWGCCGPLIIDARIKPHHAPALEMPLEIEKKIDRFWKKGGPLFSV